MDFAKEIIEWYHQHKRDLPWRHTTDPYLIWLSEIILQQTRVEQGMPYFYRFREHYPSIKDFALADEGAILNDWQGLGYYSRARNMHHTAKMVMDKHQGVFPKAYDELIKLKGIGEYTAAAIASFANNEPKAVVDGNVFRLLSRYFGIDTPINTGKGKKIFTELANELLTPAKAGLYNQAVMEFGAMQCKPKNPPCETCPLQPNCFAYKNDQIAQLPKKNKNLKIRERYFNYVVLEHNGSMLMHQRNKNDIWQNLFEFPLFETSELVSPAEIIQSETFIKYFGREVRLKSVNGPIKHILTHQRLWAQFIQIEMPSYQNLNPEWKMVSQEELKNLAQPKLIFDFIIKFLN
ncbi:MAG: A/G-specific adenine glycosylase [Sphingobacteriaceae bacterium]